MPFYLLVYTTSGEMFSNLQSNLSIMTTNWRGADVLYRVSG